MQFFLDTSALVKLYHQEEGSDIVAEIFRKKYPLVISELSKVEFLSTATKKFRMREITAKALKSLKVEFLADCSETFVVIPMASSIMDGAIDFIEKHGKSGHIFSLDAVQVASFLMVAEDDATFVCADRRLTSLVKKLGYNVVEV